MRERTLVSIHSRGIAIPPGLSLCGSQGRYLPPLLRIPSLQRLIFYRIFCQSLTPGKSFDSISPLVIRYRMAHTMTIPARSLSRAVLAAAAAAAVPASHAIVIDATEGKVS